MSIAEKDMKKLEALKSLISSEGWAYYVSEMREIAALGLEKFVNLPAEKMTTKVAQEHKANYKVRRECIEWPAEQVRLLEGRK